MTPEQWELEPHPIRFMFRQDLEQIEIDYLLRIGAPEDSWPAAIGVQLKGRQFPEVWFSH